MLRKLICASIQNEKINKKNQASQNHKLYKDILTDIFIYLNQEELAKVACVCQLWSGTSGLDKVWRPLAKNYLINIGFFSEESLKNLKNIKKHYENSIQIKQFKKETLSLDKQINKNFDILHSEKPKGPSMYDYGNADTLGYDLSFCYYRITNYLEDKNVREAIVKMTSQKEKVINKIKFKEEYSLEFFSKVNYNDNDEVIQDVVFHSNKCE